jgi:leucyl/phenylalanyl-tRNA--protein transferase
MPPILRFPDPRDTGPEGLLALGGDMHPDSLRLAYERGIFPWPIEGAPALTWFSPVERGILDFKELHWPRSLRKFAAKKPYRFTFDRAFEQVISECQAAYRPGQPGTWITPELRDAYVEFHRQGFAHSTEAWVQADPSAAPETGELVGGMYGVYLDGVFAGESMFFKKPNASKLALLHLVDRLRAHGIDWMDIQVMTPHMERLGARLIPRDDFLERLQRTHERFRGRPHPF